MSWRVMGILAGCCLLSAATARAQVSTATSTSTSAATSTTATGQPSVQTSPLATPTGPPAGTGLGSATGGGIGIGGLTAPVSSSTTIPLILAPINSPAPVLPSTVGAGNGAAISTGIGPGAAIPGVTAAGESLSSAGTSVMPPNLTGLTNPTNLTMTASPGGPVGGAATGSAPATTPTPAPGLAEDLLGY